MSKGMSRKNRKYFRMFKGIILFECAVISVLTVQIIAWMKNGNDNYDNIYVTQIKDKVESTVASEITEIITESTTESMLEVSVESSLDDLDVTTTITDNDDFVRVYTRNDVYNYASIEKRDDYEYPDYMESMLERYNQTIMFYNDFPDKRNVSPANNVGALVEGEIPFMLQWDERWGYSEFGDNIIGCAGCGPTCLSMIISGLTGDNTVTPYVVGKYIDENGYYTYGEGTAWSAMTDVASHFGIQAENISNVRDYVYESLEDGHPIICSVGPGSFTTGGHFIVLAGLKDGKIIINDPNSIENSKKLWDLDEFQDEISNMWSYSLEE